MYPHALKRENPPSATLTRIFYLTFPHITTKFSLGQHPQFPFLAFCGQDNKGKISAPISALLYPTIPPPQHHFRPHTYHIPPDKVNFMPNCAITRRHALLKERFPFVSQNILSMHSSCYSFDIYANHSIHLTLSIRHRERCITSMMMVLG